jgi:hypothetical protein
VKIIGSGCQAVWDRAEAELVDRQQDLPLAALPVGGVAGQQVSQRPQPASPRRLAGCPAPITGPRARAGGRTNHRK